MTDIKDPRLLWTKGGLFLFLGLFAGWLIWIKARSFETVLLLAIFAWAFSRAYYFAFYVIEKYADPTYRYSGLLSLLGYMRAKALNLPYSGSLQSAKSATPPPDIQATSPQTVLTNAEPSSSALVWRKVLYECVWWFVVANLANITTPSIYSRLIWSRRHASAEWLSDIVFTSLMGGFCAQLAVIGILAGLIRRPVKWTLPIAILASLLCWMIVCFGQYMVEEPWGSEPVVVAGIGAVSSEIVVFAASFAFKVASGLGCDVVVHTESEQASQSSQINQISIKYILIATTIIGLLVAFGKSLNLSGAFANLGSEELVFGLLSLVVLILFGLTFLALIGWLCLATIRNDLRVRLLVLLGVMIIVGSVMMPQVFSVVQQQSRDVVTAGSEDIPMAASYIVSFCMTTALILFSFRLAGLRLTMKAI